MGSSASAELNEDIQQTPVNDQSDSEGYDFKTVGHSTNALTNMYEMKQRGQLPIISVSTIIGAWFIAGITILVKAMKEVQALKTDSSFCLPGVISALRMLNPLSSLCDVILKLGLETFKAHRVVLASVSSYFFAMFNAEIQGEMKEQVYSEIVLDRRDIDTAGIKLLLDYAYTGQITITSDTVQVLLTGSVLLEMQEVREACCHFLGKQLRPTNCLGIRRLAVTVPCKELLLTTHCFIMDNFQQVADTKEFSLLPFNEVEKLVSDKQINSSSEEDVFAAVLNWIKHDVINRRQYIRKLMVHVRLRLVSRKFLMTVVDKEPLMHEDSQCREVLIETMRYHLDSENPSDLATSITVEDKPKEAEPYLFAIGGLETSECEVYNPRSDSWTTVAPMLSKREGSGVTGLHGLLYAVGGGDGTSKLATAECYNPLFNTWTPIIPMSTTRDDLGVCSLDGLIYACGGFGGNPRSMEKFDPLTGVWYSCPAMTIKRDYCRIAPIENCIYAVGGSGNKTHTVEKFDPRLGNWSPVPSISSRRGRYGVAAIGVHLYRIGGWDGINGLSSGERFDVRNNAWEPISAMHNRRWRHGVVAIDGCIYAVGGYDGFSNLNSVEKYDPQTNTWSEVSSMVTKRFGLWAAVLDCVDIEHVLKRTNS